MTSNDFSPDTVQPPSDVITAVTAVARVLLNGPISTALTGWGLLQPSETTKFVAYGVAAAIWLATYGWSRYEFYTHKANAAVRVAQAKAS